MYRCINVTFPNGSIACNPIIMKAIVYVNFFSGVFKCQAIMHLIHFYSRCMDEMHASLFVIQIKIAYQVMINDIFNPYGTNYHNFL